jgi:hypothetical protein
MKLIYLHIPKSAGTSQRFVLSDIYGQDSVFWYGTDAEPLAEYSAGAISGYPIVGGHKPISHYPESLDAIYLSVVREPLLRAVSFYSYLVKPDMAESRGRSVETRQKHTRLWLDKGMDQNSILRSLEQCAEFREQVTNWQCSYLSRGQADFDGALATLRQSRSLVGTMEQIGQFNQALARLLSWPLVPNRSLNRSLPGSHKHLLEDGLEEVLEGLLVEDQKLYRYISDECSGLLNTLPEGFQVPSELTPRVTLEEQLASLKVQVYGKGFVGIRDSGAGGVGVILYNISPVCLDPGNFPEMGLCADVLDDSGQRLLSQEIFQPIYVPIESEEKVLCTLRVEIPAEVLPRARTVSVRFSLVPGDREDSFGSLLGASLAILRV